MEKFSTLHFHFGRSFDSTLLTSREEFYIHPSFNRLYSEIFLFSLRRKFAFTCVMMAYVKVFFVSMQHRSNHRRQSQCDGICICQHDLAGLYMAVACWVSLYKNFFEPNSFGRGEPRRVGLFKTRPVRFSNLVLRMMSSVDCLIIATFVLATERDTNIALLYDCPLLRWRTGYYCRRFVASVSCLSFGFGF